MHHNQTQNKKNDTVNEQCFRGSSGLQLTLNACVSSWLLGDAECHDSECIIPIGTENHNHVVMQLKY